jgi:hypothetical protein
MAVAISRMRNITSFSNWRKEIESTPKLEEDESGNRTEQSSLQTTTKAEDSNYQTEEGQQQQWKTPFLRLSQAVRSPILPKADASLRDSLPGDETEKSDKDPEEETRQKAEEEAMQKAQGGGIFSRFRLKASGGDAEKGARIRVEEVLSSSDQKNNKKETSQGGGIISFFQEKSRLKAEEEARVARLKAEEEAIVKAEKEAELKAEEEARMKVMEEAMKNTGFEINFATDKLVEDEHLVNDDDSNSSSNNSGDSLSNFSMTKSEISEMKRIHFDLEEKGLPPVFTVQQGEHHDHQSHTSCISLGEESYVQDLLNQKEQREGDIREQALEEALELYLVAIEKNFPESEEMFQMIFQEVLKESTEKGKEKAMMQDEILERKKHLVQKVLNRKQRHETEGGGLKKKLSNLLGMGRPRGWG